MFDGPASRLQSSSMDKVAEARTYPSQPRPSQPGQRSSFTPKFQAPRRSPLPCSQWGLSASEPVGQAEMEQAAGRVPMPAWSANGLRSGAALNQWLRANIMRQKNGVKAADAVSSTTSSCPGWHPEAEGPFSAPGELSQHMPSNNPPRYKRGQQSNCGGMETFERETVSRKRIEEATEEIDDHICRTSSMPRMTSLEMASGTSQQNYERVPPPYEAAPPSSAAASSPPQYRHRLLQQRRKEMSPEVAAAVATAAQRATAKILASPSLPQRQSPFAGGITSECMASCSSDMKCLHDNGFLLPCRSTKSSKACESGWRRSAAEEQGPLEEAHLRRRRPIPVINAHSAC